MKNDYARQLIEYIAYIFRTCDHAIPTNQDNWCFVVPTFSVLAEEDTILGFPVFVAASIGSFDFQLCIPAQQALNWSFLKAFNERLEEVTFRGDCNYDNQHK